MILDELIEEVAVLVERERADVARGLRNTWNQHEGTLDDYWVSELQCQVLSLLTRFADADKVEAYNELADAEGFSRLEEGEQDVDYWIHEAFIDPVIDRLLEPDLPNIQHLKAASENT
jgi:hypothetical protein